MESLRSIEELIRELDQPNLSGWKLFAQTSDVKVYRQADDDVKSLKLTFNNLLYSYRN
jgi:hypothetical protein